MSCEPVTPVAPTPLAEAKARRSAEGETWLRNLPGRVAELCRVWNLRLGETLTGGTAAFVARVEHADGAGAVLKLPVPAAGNARSTRTLVTAAGRGYAQVLEHDGDDLLLELLGPSLDRTGYPPQRQLRVLADLLPIAWEVGVPGDPVDQGAGLADLLTHLLTGPTDPVAARALQFARRRSAAFRPDTARVLHGDAAPPNALLAPGRTTEAVFVDPDGFAGDPAYDVGVGLRDFSAELLTARTPAALLRGWCHDSATRTGQDPQAVWEWAFLERVTTGRYVQSLGAEDLARPFLASARRLLPDG